jgi:uncharacterized protein (DUF362 family)
MNHVVFARSLTQSPEGISHLMDSAGAAIGLEKAAKSARSVFIKPNLTFPTYKIGVTTSAEFVEEIVQLLLRMNPKLRVFIGEGEGGYNSFSMSKAMSTMGFDRIAANHPQVELVNLSTVPSRAVQIDTLRGPYTLELPELFFKDVDFSISVPLPKIHCMTRLTLSFKNLWGCLPDVMRLKNHYMFPHIISKVAEILKFRYAFLDGKVGLNNNGPMEGDPVEVNWFVASNSLGAFDMIVSEMMGHDWKKIDHLKIANRYGLMPQREEISIVGDVKSLQRKFVLKRTMWNYPALAAFHSKNLTHLFYFSALAGVLHRLMYTFRRRAIV